jgi:predicted DNA-binding protein (UPF0251 family)
MQNNKRLFFLISLTDAAKAIGVSRTAVRKALDTGRTVKGQYFVTTKKN